MKTIVMRLTAIGLSAIGMVGCATSKPDRSESVVGEVALPAGRVYDMSSVTIAPRPVFQSRPKYPSELRKAGVSGEGVVLFTIRTSGVVDDITVVSATDPRFGLAAAESVKSWRFEPAQVNGRAVACRMEVPIVFTVDQR